MTSQIQAAAPPKPAPGRPAKGNGISTPSRRGGSGRVLTDVIVDLGFVEREAMDNAVEMAHAAGSAAERVLISTGAITERELARAVAERFGLDHFDLQLYRVDPDAAQTGDITARDQRIDPVISDLADDQPVGHAAAGKLGHIGGAERAPAVELGRNLGRDAARADLREFGGFKSGAAGERDS